MAKKDFTNIDTGSVYDTIANATAQDAQEEQKAHKSRREYTAEERKKYIDEMRTAGRKGLKLDRINLSITPDNLDYVRTMATVTGMNMTTFINFALKQHREDRGELYEKAIEFRKSMSL